MEIISIGLILIFLMIGVGIFEGSKNRYSRSKFFGCSEIKIIQKRKLIILNIGYWILFLIGSYYLLHGYDFDKIS